MVLPAGLGGDTGKTFLDREGAILPAELRAVEAEVAPAMMDEETATGGVVAAAPAAPPPPVPPEPGPTPAAEGGRFALEVDGADGTVEIHDLPPGEHLLGRGAGCAIRVDNPTLSRHHARLIVVKGRVRVVDLASTNHTFVDESELPARTEAEVVVGSALRFGMMTARLVRKEPS